MQITTEGLSSVVLETNVIILLDSKSEECKWDVW